MSTTIESEDALSQEGEYTGVLYWVSVPSGKKINLDNLRTHLDNRIFEEDITDTLDRETKTPKIFKQDGRVVRETSIINAKTAETSFGKVVVADVKMDRDSTVNYRDQDILTMDVYVSKIVFFEQNDTVYLLIIASRKVSNAVAHMLKTKYDQLGELINGTRLPNQSLEKIVDELDAGLNNTIISQFPDEDVSKIEFTGDGFENNRAFKQQQNRGETQGHMFRTDEPAGSTSLTVRISNDGLVRIRNKVALRLYLQLVSTYVIPYVHRDEEGSASLSAFNSNADSPIFEDQSKQ